MMESRPIPFRERGVDPKLPPLLLFFEEVASRNELETRKQGAPIFDSVAQVRIVVPGVRDDAPIYEVERRLPDGKIKRDLGVYERFKEPFEHWRKGERPADTGTPLEQWPLADVALVATLKAANVFTVQQLAGLTEQAIDDGALRRGGREWREKARAWLEAATGVAGDVEARATIARQQQEINDLKMQVTELLKKQNTIGFQRKPGRPRKLVEEADVEAALSSEEADEEIEDNRL